MSNEKPDKLIDFSNYDGDYQEGELLGEDGEAIDMEDLKGDNPPRAPLVIKLLFVLLCVTLGAVGYWTFILKTPPPPPPPPRAKVERNKTLDASLEKLVSVRTKEFFPLAKCWAVLARAQATKKAPAAAMLAKKCPPLQAGASQYKAQCADAACGQIVLARCQGAACTPVENTLYIDFLQMVVLRVADSYNRLIATLRLYEKASSDLKLAKERKADTSQSAAEVKKYGAALELILSAKGATKTEWHKSYFGLSHATMYAQALAHLKSLQTSPAAAIDKPKKKKKKRRRRRRRRKSAPAKASAALWGGTLYGDARWPVKGLSHPNYKSLDLYKIEFTPDSVPATLESKADSLSVKGNLEYTAATVQFWTFLMLQHSFHQCAAEHAKTKSYTATFTSLVQSEGGRFFNNGTQVEVDPPSPAVAECLSKEIRLNKINIGYRGLPPEPKQVTVKFKVVLKP